MQISVLGQAVNVRVTSHILESDPLNPDLFNMLHCWRCGKKITQFNGHEIMAVPGPIPVFASLPVLLQCHVCKQRHLLNSIL